MASSVVINMHLGQEGRFLACKIPYFTSIFALDSDKLVPTTIIYLSDRQVWANSADPDRSSLIRVYTVCNSIYIFWMHYSKERPSCSTFRVITINFRVSKILGFLHNLSWMNRLIMSLYQWRYERRPVWNRGALYCPFVSISLRMWGETNTRNALWATGTAAMRICELIFVLHKPKNRGSNNHGNRKAWALLRACPQAQIPNYKKYICIKKLRWPGR